jgi:hypothetical protein|tara:strand:+ start:2893 stop:3012 length:120 start_codon:yes stop_codon:yes gene_type:complete
MRILGKIVRALETLFFATFILGGGIGTIYALYWLITLIF